MQGGDGDLVKHTGDGFLARFDTVGDAIRVAVAVQRDLAASTLTSVELRVRMAVHAGEAERRDDDWFGTTINRAARLLELSHGGQILVSGVVAALTDDMPIGGCTLLDLGVHPLRDLTVPEHVFQVLAPGLDARVPALRGVAEIAARPLPRRRSSFVGRRGELERAPTVIDDHRLISLVGAGGIGKTRLAEEITIGRSVAGDRVWWVDLTRADHADDVAAVLVDATNARGSPGADPVDVVAGALMRAGRGLLVVDNCEHVLATIGDVVDRLLNAVGSLTVLATSRRPLGLDGEHVWRLAPLSLPLPGAGTEDGSPPDAVTLFLERARQVQPDLVIDAANRPSVDEICRRLDGIPLALELAAARLRHVAFGDLLASLEGTFPLLRDEHQPIRHRALSDSLQSSHDVLSPPAQELLWFVAGFIGPFTGKAAANLGVAEGAVLLDRLGELVDASLVEFDVGTGRYRLLETVRQFALSTATAHGYDADLRDRHLARCVALATMWAADQTVISLDVVDDIVGERSNLVAALEWSCRPGRQPAVELVAPLAAAAIARRLVADTSAWSTRLLAALDGPDRTTWARAVASCARLRTELGDVEFLERAVPAAAEIARASGDVATEASCMTDARRSRLRRRQPDMVDPAR